MDDGCLRFWNLAAAAALIPCFLSHFPPHAAQVVVEVTKHALRVLDAKGNQIRHRTPAEEVCFFPIPTLEIGENKRVGIHPPGLLTPLLRARCAQVTYCSINDGKSMVAFVEARENAMTGDYENQVGWGKPEFHAPKNHHR